MKHRLRRQSAAVSLSVAALMLVGGAYRVPAAHAAVNHSEADYSGFATSTPIHVDAIETADTRVVDAEEAFTGAAVDSKGIEEIQNEMDRIVTRAGENSMGRGTALEVGLVHAPSAENQIILKGLAEARSGAPDDATEEIGPVDLDPIAYASLLKSTAMSDWNAGSCILGGDISRAHAEAADVQLVATGGATPGGDMAAPAVATDLDAPRRNVTNSVSRTTLVPQVDESGATRGDNFGLMAETRQTIAPVSLLNDSLIIEVLGEWVLRTVAGGVDGTGWVHYGPAAADPDTPLVTIDVAPGLLPVDLPQIRITSQQLLGSGGLNIPIDIPGVANVDIAIGEAPRAIGGDFGSAAVEAPDGTRAAAAVDVVRVTTELLGTLSVEDVRIGHMEASVAVPAGGIACPIPVTKSPSSTTVGSGGAFDTTITVTNPFDCTLTNVVLTDTLSGVPATLSNADQGGTIAGSVATWNLPDIPPGGSVTVKVTTTAGRTPGDIIDTANVTAQCGIGNVEGTGTVNVGLNGTGSATVNAGTAGLVLGVQLPRTGGTTPLYVAAAVMALLGAGFAGWKGYRLVRQTN